MIRCPQEDVARAGLGYEFMLRDGWFVKSYVAVNFIENEDSEEVYGVYVGRAF